MGQRPTYRALFVALEITLAVMAYSDVIDNCSGISFFLGKTINAYYSTYSYAALRMNDGEVFTFAVDEVVVGKWFEVFPIQPAESPTHEFSWKELEIPFVVDSCMSLWREEWQEPTSDSGEFMGSGPHSVQFAMPLGSAPSGIGNVIKIHAGLVLTDKDGNLLAICSSRNTPFEMNFAIGKEACLSVFEGHTCQ